MQDRDHLKILFDKWYQGTASPAEAEELHVLLGEKAAVDAIKYYSKEKWEQAFRQEIDWSAPPAAMVDKILAVSGKKEDENEMVPPVHRVHFLRTAWFRYAAVILLMFGTAAYLWLRSANKKTEFVHQSSAKPAGMQPGGNKAILTLANGSTIILDSAAVGHLAEQGNTKIIKLDAGSLAYNNQSLSGSLPPGGEVMYNTIRTPKGGQYQVVLPDGSRVWLNAASSVRFPTSFTGSERNVEIQGEAYFEIKKDAAKPFSVTADRTRVLVLGTSFNVDAYYDEAALKTTLIEGSVRVNSDKQSEILLPGQQAQISTTAKGQPLRVVNADISKVLAWKNGFFNFEDASLQTVMKQLERWYNIDVVYEKGIPDIYFVGKMSMKMNQEGVLKMLKDSEVHFRMEGRKLIVMP